MKEQKEEVQKEVRGPLAKQEQALRGPQGPPLGHPAWGPHQLEGGPQATVPQAVPAYTP